MGRSAAPDGTVIAPGDGGGMGGMAAQPGSQINVYRVKSCRFAAESHGTETHLLGGNINV